MIEVPVYAPRPRDPGRGRMFLARTVEPHSAIVGSDDTTDDGWIVVYYEGNKYGAVNMVTFADKAMFAYWRMRDRYPTVAMAAVPRRQLVRIGTLYPEHYRVQITNARQMVALAHWLEIPVGPGLSERLESQLRCEGVRPAGGVR